MRSPFRTICQSELLGGCISFRLSLMDHRQAGSSQAPVFLVLTPGPQVDRWLRQARNMQTVVTEPQKRSGAQGILSHAYAKPERPRYPKRDKE